METKSENPNAPTSDASKQPPTHPVKEFKRILSNCIRIRQPKSWPELSDEEAWTAFAMMAEPNNDPATAPVRFFLLLNRISVLATSASGEGWLCSMPGGTLFELTGELAARLAEPLAFILRPNPDRPWRPERFRGFRAISPELHELTFADWLVICNTLQGVIFTGDYSLMDDLNLMLMQRPSAIRAILRGSAELHFTPGECLAAFHWLLSVRDTYIRRYPALFPDHADGRQSEDSNPPTADELRESNDALLRALTQGDVTKEEAVMDLPISRALAELNAKAREYAEMKTRKP